MSSDATKDQSRQEHAAPGELHRTLDVFIGEWNAKATVCRSPAPDPMTSPVGRLGATWERT